MNKASSKRYLFFVSESYGLGILRPLQTAIRARGGEAAWFFHKDHSHKLSEDEQQLKSVAAAKAFNPDAVITANNWLPHFFPGVKVQVFHGFNARKRGLTEHLNIRGFFDLYCSQGPDTTPQLQELARKHGYFDVVETGWCKVDPLFSAMPAAYKTPQDKPTVLFASTFTERITAAPHLIETISAMAQTGQWHWLVTLHPKMNRETIEAYQSIQCEHLEFVETDDVIPLLKAADVMLCDTSSIMQEFLLLNRPVVTFRTQVPDTHWFNVTEPGEIQKAIETALSRPPDLMAAVEAFGQQLQAFRDGKSSERVLDAIDTRIVKTRQQTAKKPWNLWRKWQVRQRLGYYSFR